MQQVWRKRWRNTGWIALGAITLVLLVSAVHKKNNKECTGIEVSFSEDKNSFFVDEKGITSILKSYGIIKGAPIESIDLKALETRLKNDRWIADAQLFFDNKQILRIIVEERQPVARIFTLSGSSFYIDSTCRKLPLSEKLSVRVPMFTSFPSDRSALSRPDSELLANVKDLATFINQDDFWKAQVEQVDITPDGFEMIPTVGNHVVELGKDGDWQQKFDRLFSFYKQVSVNVGFEKYEKIDVQFDGQVVATLKGTKPKTIDSAKARIAYEHLLSEVKKSDADSVSIPVVADEKTDAANTTIEAGDGNAAVAPSPAKNVKGKAVVAKQSAVKQVAKSKVVKQLASNKAVHKMIPKAVMKKPVVRGKR
jgi:cell division protein FtsQ